MAELNFDYVLEMFECIESRQTKVAFFKLYSKLVDSEKYFVSSVSKGNFKAIHLSTRAEARPFSDSEKGAELALKCSKNHLIWWFRLPAFKAGFIDFDEVVDAFDTTTNGKHELVVKLADVADVDHLLDFIGL
ncbi:MAG: hypothetical protein WBC71_03705 [Salaquimonas sp.]